MIRAAIVALVSAGFTEFHWLPVLEHISIRGQAVSWFRCRHNQFLLQPQALVIPEILIGFPNTFCIKNPHQKLSFR
jgi:hypothetical protein